MAKRSLARNRLIPDLPGIKFTRTSRRTSLGEQDPEFLAWDVQVGGTYPEFLVYKELERRGLDRGIDFEFQSAFFGGRNQLGGAVVDFIVMPDLVGRVQGEFFHLRNSRVKGNDIIQKRKLQGRGFRVIDMLEDEIIESPHRVVELFLNGSETPLAASQG